MTLECSDLQSSVRVLLVTVTSPLLVEIAKRLAKAYPVKIPPMTPIINRSRSFSTASRTSV